MNEQDNKAKNGFIDLGSDAINDDFDPFASDDDFGDETESDTQMKQVSPKKETSSATTNPLAKAVNKAEDKDTEQAQQTLYDKSPVFEYAGATENIDDTAKTFDELRIEKSDDFPELRAPRFPISL